MKKQKKPILFITGSSRGIGASVARLSKKYGYEVILHGKTKSKNLLNIANELESNYLYFDVTKEDQIQSSLRELTHINALVNSAGINISKSFEDLTSRDWEKTYSNNVIGLSNVIKYSLPKLRNAKTVTRIVNIASIKGTYSEVGRVAYASSKASVINLTCGLAKEFAPEILVNSVSPGFTKTEMTSNSWSERIEKQVESILLKRIASPNEIAELVLFLCSNKCTYITGQNINVDGGFSIKNI